MEAAGLTVSVLAEVRALATRNVSTIANSKKPPEGLSGVYAILTRILLAADAIHDIGVRNCSSFPEEMALLDHVSLLEVGDSLFEMEKNLEEHQVIAASLSYRIFGAFLSSKDAASIEQGAKYAEAELNRILGQQISILVGQRMTSDFCSGTCRATDPVSTVSSPKILPFADTGDRSLDGSAEDEPVERCRWCASKDSRLVPVKVSETQPAEETNKVVQHEMPTSPPRGFERPSVAARASLSGDSSGGGAFSATTVNLTINNFN